MAHEELVGRVQHIIQCTAHHSPFTTEDSVWWEPTLPPSLPSQGDSSGPLLLDQTAGTIGRKVQEGVDGCLFILVLVSLFDLALISSKAPIHRDLGWLRCAISHFAHAAACWKIFIFVLTNPQHLHPCLPCICSWPPSTYRTSVTPVWLAISPISGAKCQKINLTSSA